MFDAVDSIFSRTMVAALLLTVIAMTLGLGLAQLGLRAPILRIEATTRLLEQGHATSPLGRIHCVRELADLARHVDRLADALARPSGRGLDV